MAGGWWLVAGGWWSAVVPPRCGARVQATDEQAPQIGKRKRKRKREKSNHNQEPGGRENRRKIPPGLEISFSEREERQRRV